MRPQGLPWAAIEGLRTFYFYFEECFVVLFLPLNLREACLGVYHRRPFEYS
jgi:hypothetical protein